MSIKMNVVKVKVPEGTNVILGQSHFIKTVEDIYEAMVNTVPNIKFGLAFCEASGDKLIRYDGNDDELVKDAVQVARDVGAGHFFVLFIKDAYPINVLQRLKTVPEVVTIFCATANPVEVIIGETQQGRAILGVVDGFTPLGVEDEEKKKERHVFLRKIGYKK
ncbi:MAG: adenosine-specific kinase [Candidatus Odinarchaeota archaeon]|nr:adenosine-specific kinase [Candidatus Odinarchaeota archaeon]